MATLNEKLVEAAADLAIALHKWAVSNEAGVPIAATSAHGYAVAKALFEELCERVDYAILDDLRAVLLNECSFTEDDEWLQRAAADALPTLVPPQV